MLAALWLLPYHVQEGQSASKAVQIDWPDFGDIKKKIEFALVVHNVGRTLEWIYNLILHKWEYIILYTANVTIGLNNRTF